LIDFQKLFKHSVFLLLTTGFLIGLNFPLGKLAGDAGVSPIVWAFIISLGALMVLLPLLIAHGTFSFLSAGEAGYAIVSGLITFVSAPLLVFFLIPRTGSGYIGLMFAMSPVFTLALSLLFRIKAPDKLGILGIAIGFVGAGLVAFSRQSGREEVELIWILAALLIPMTLACGNIYRTLAWPENLSPDNLAFWSHLFSAAILLVLVVMSDGLSAFVRLSGVTTPALFQILVGGLTFPVYFRLQYYGGPVLLSQIGYVGAAVALIAATLFLGETYNATTWAGAGIIALAIGITIMAQRARK